MLVHIPFFLWFAIQDDCFEFKLRVFSLIYHFLNLKVWVRVHFRDKCDDLTELVTQITFLICKGLSLFKALLVPCRAFFFSLSRFLWKSDQLLSRYSHFSVFIRCIFNLLRFEVNLLTHNPSLLSCLCEVFIFLQRVFNLPLFKIELLACTPSLLSCLCEVLIFFQVKKIKLSDVSHRCRFFIFVITKNFELFSNFRCDEFDSIERFRLAFDFHRLS